MLNAIDQATFLAIRELRRTVESTRPLVIWVGAGASKWLGYPLWKELARNLRREFFKLVPNFENGKAVELIERGSLPEFFQLCRDLDRQHYHRFLSNAFLPRPVTPLYQHFAESLRKLRPLQILTTNVDEAIEQRVPEAAVFQRSDIGGCLDQIREGRPFIAKLHGSRSAIQTAVFTTTDYENLKSDTSFINILRQIFAMATVLFVGYSVSDQYVIDLLSDNARDMSLFGAGPHFVVGAQFVSVPPLRQINYSLERFPDHRSALTVLEIVTQVQGQTAASPAVVVDTKPPGTATSPLGTKTGYLISDLLPPGTWTNSTTAEFFRRDGMRSQMTVGLGFLNDELPSLESSALHDVTVGLTCFDFVYFPLSNVGRVHEVLGSELLQQLLQADVLRFIYLREEPAVMSLVGGLIGDVGLMTLANRTGQPVSPAVLIRRHLNSVPGKEADAEELFTQIEKRVTIFDAAARLKLADLVRSSVMMPEVARLLGIGEAILPTQVPSWLTFPYLRLAHLVHTGAVCEQLGLQAAKIPFGGAKLTSAAFGAQASTESADRYASYLLTGSFNVNLSALLASQLNTLRQVVRFRSMAEGEAFRREVRDQLLANETTAFAASINAGLRRNIPLAVLQSARDRMSSLFTENIAVSPVPAVWTNTFQTDDAMWRWRAKARERLLALANERGIRRDDPCLCGSGDKLRLCCLPPLRN